MGRARGATNDITDRRTHQRAGRPGAWRLAAAAMFAVLVALLCSAVATTPAAGRAGGSGVASVAGFVAEDRRRLSAETERVRSERAALGPGGAASPARPAPSASASPTPSPPAPAPTPEAPAPVPVPDADDPRLRRAELAAQVGLTAVRGPAVTVELDDAARETRGRPLPAGIRSPGPNDLVVHQQDVQAVVNALWAGGAEAMAIMNHRVTPRTAVRCVGNTLLLEGRVYSPPFRISAIGDQTALRGALDGDPGVQLYRDYVAAYGLGYRVVADADLLLPAHSGDPLTGTGPGTG
ncbi:hypothetical protein CC117_08320 [Parafrankia colletiae]|uniref:DUF881 domain-containing protein n=1 Tax=Parafrankia colletiae TaxID=573497 RepID=A0A1S1Q376_9ACTN|nr:DUF881 domain-containing protein [Parafrankia colletiae]MCK9898981.1 DUF881 domain-containing protein [Frankia sp. Cpl3]OHV29353.1 hypothetical protein CC117_08320 [Parafrankia colletiae]